MQEAWINVPPSGHSAAERVPAAATTTQQDAAGLIIAEPDPTAPQPVKAQDKPRTRKRQRGRAKGRELFCPAHPDTAISGNGQKYFLHLLQPEELKQRGMSHKKAQLVIKAYPVLVLSNEWLEKLFCPDCGSSRWCHVVRHDKVRHDVRWAPRNLWEQVAHVHPMETNPSVSEFSRREARRLRPRRTDGKRLFDRG